MNILQYILIFNLIGSIISLIGGALLLLNKNFAGKVAHLLSSFAAGALLGTVFFDLIPESLDSSGNAEQVFLFTLGGILFFFLVERFLHWFHHHEYNESEITGKPIIPLIAVGDTIHNFVDGMAIAATFLVSIPLGIVTSIAVGAHEIPQEIGDFGVMIKKGLSRKKTLTINICSALASFVGALLVYYFGQSIEGLSTALISVTAGFFLYVALSDLIPEIHHENKKGLAIWETFYLLLGVGSIYAALYIIENVFHITP